MFVAPSALETIPVSLLSATGTTAAGGTIGGSVELEGAGVKLVGTNIVSAPSVTDVGAVDAVGVLLVPLVGNTLTPGLTEEIPVTEGSGLAETLDTKLPETDGVCTGVIVGVRTGPCEKLGCGKPEGLTVRAAGGKNPTLSPGLVEGTADIDVSDSAIVGDGVASVSGGSPMITTVGDGTVVIC